MAEMKRGDMSGMIADFRKAFESGRTLSIHWRRKQISQLKKMVTERESMFMDALRADLGKPVFEGWVSEIGSLRLEIDYTLSRLREWMKSERVPTPLINQPGRSYIRNQPLGIVLIIGPWNYPFLLVLAPLLGAIAAGNCAVIKPPDLAPRSSALLAELLPEYLDRSCVGVAEGGVQETQALLGERFDHIFFTGSPRVGRLVMQAAAGHLTPVTLELGGKNPCIVDKTVNPELAARRIAWGKFFNAGQTCISPDYILADREIEEPLVQGICRSIGEFYGPDPRQSPDLGRIVNERHYDRLMALLDDGAKIVTGGKGDRGARYIAPTVLRDVSPGSKIMQEEIFGPLLPVLSVADTEEAVRFVNDRPRPLALYIFSNRKKTQRRVLDATSSGNVCINDAITQTRVPGLPFGGIGESGMGCYHGRYSYDTFTHRRGVLHKAVFVDPPMRYPPYNEKKLSLARRLM
jgi:aldehyde dehydrogenase (NAD+)